MSHPVIQIALELTFSLGWPWIHSDPPALVLSAWITDIIHHAQLLDII